MSLLKSFQHTKIVTSHDLDMVFDICTRIMVIKEGEVIADGSATEILTNAELLKGCGLEVPLSIQNCPVCGQPKILK